MDSSQYVRVAINIRPLISSELRIGCTDCITIVPGDRQVQIGSHSFTYDHVYGSTRLPSSAIFNDGIALLVDAFFRGYNATVLAYGQKKHTPWELTIMERSIGGIIPEVMDTIFKRIETERFHGVSRHSFLFRGGRVRAAEAVGPAGVPIQIRETVHGGIILPGLTEAEVKMKEEMAFHLSRGCLSHATGSTNMNIRSR